MDDDDDERGDQDFAGDGTLPSRVGAPDDGAGRGQRAGRRHEAFDPAAPAIPHEIIDKLYDVAMDPRRYEELLDSWESRVGPIRSATADLASDPGLQAHLRRADTFLDRYRAPSDIRAEALAPFDGAASFVVERDLAVSLANPMARNAFGLDGDPRLGALPLAPPDLASLRRALQALFAAAAAREPGGSAMLRCTSTLTGRPILFQVRLSSEPRAFALVVTSEFHWPDGLTGTLREAFGLTATEVELVRALVEAQAPREIAEARGRSVDTVRTQIKTILTKTGTHAQSELVRVCLAMMDIVGVTMEAGRPAGAYSRATPLLEPREFVTLTAPDGRRHDHLVLGDPDGRPCLYLPQDLGFVRWPAAAERYAASRSIRAIVPVRPGYGRSDAPPKASDRGEGYAALVAADMAALLDHYGIARAPVLSQAADSCFAFHFAARHPERTTAIVAPGGNLPFAHARQFERMHKWHRFIIANARFAPAVLPFLARSGFVLAEQIGKDRFGRVMYGASEADMAVLDNPDTMDALMAGSDVVLWGGGTAHAAFAREAIEKCRDWSDAVRGVAAPVLIMHGDDDPQAHPDTFAEWRAAWPAIGFEAVERAGQLLFFSHWRRVLDRLEPYLD